MSGGGRRGRRGGRRQRRREQERNAAASISDVGAPASAAPVSAASAPGLPVSGPPAPAPPAAAPAPPAHPRPMSARALVAKLEAKRAEADHAAHPPEHEQNGDDAALNAARSAETAAALATEREPRCFTADGIEYIARSAGIGAAGTGRLAQARIEAIRFARADAPDTHVAEVLLPGTKLDLLYDEELAELLERGLRSRTGHG